MKASAVGRGYADRLLLSVGTQRGGDAICIISARKASPGEPRHYEDRPMHEEYDFSKAKRAKEVPALAKAQAENAGKERITIRLDKEVLAWFRSQVKGGGNYHTLINEALGAYTQEQEGSLERILRRD